MAQTTNTQATRIIGGVGCGKTQELINRVIGLLKGGAAASDVLVACATPQAALAFEERLRNACDDETARDVVVTTPRALALKVLSGPDARRWTGRAPRLLTAYEELFLLEDMKVSGLRPKRLREMLKFFYRSWTELADDDEKWLLAGEETNIHELLKANLAFMEAIAEPEVSNLAVNYLRTHDGARAANSFAHVFVDDYQLISRASQVLTNLLARESVTIAGDRVACAQAYESYPYVAGLDEFADMHAHLEDVELTRCHRCAASATAAKRLLADPAVTSIAFEAAGDESEPGAAAANGGTVLLDFDQPEDEFLGVADYVSHALDEGFRPGDIVVATPNGTWGRNMATALAHAGVPVDELPAKQPVRGDVRDNAKCTPARILTALDLVADPSNALAWRCWCGYNDWLANSSAVSNLRAFADERGLGLVAALEAAFDHAEAAAPNSDQVVGAQRVSEARESGLALIAAAEGLAGEALLDKIAKIVTDDADASVPHVIRELCLEPADATGEEGDSAAAMAARFRARLLSPIADGTNAVAVIPYDLCTGLSPKVLVIAGFVDGFIPCRAYFDGAEMPLDKQEREHEKDTRRVYALAGKADERLVVSRFGATDLQSAGVLKLRIGRIRLRNGVRTCQIPPSEFTEQLA